MTDEVQIEPVESVENVDRVETAIDWSKAQVGVQLLLEAVGEDLDNAELQETWKCHVPSAFETFTEGTRIEGIPEVRTFEASGNTFAVKSEMPVYSFCEHHLPPYFGTAIVAYRPAGMVVELSKLSGTSTGSRARPQCESN